MNFLFSLLLVLCILLSGPSVPAAMAVDSADSAKFSPEITIFLQGVEQTVDTFIEDRKGNSDTVFEALNMALSEISEFLKANPDSLLSQRIISNSIRFSGFTYRDLLAEKTKLDELQIFSDQEDKLFLDYLKSNRLISAERIFQKTMFPYRKFNLGMKIVDFLQSLNVNVSDNESFRDSVRGSVRNSDKGSSFKGENERKINTMLIELHRITGLISNEVLQCTTLLDLADKYYSMGNRDAVDGIHSQLMEDQRFKYVEYLKIHYQIQIIFQHIKFHSIDAAKRLLSRVLLDLKGKYARYSHLFQIDISKAFFALGCNGNGARFFKKAVKNYRSNPDESCTPIDYIYEVYHSTPFLKSIFPTRDSLLCE
ncbi:MAG: hypothetical protein CVV64_20050 [Candidatus Wallbacteria bacterium HGW-Wallbacteria-1]|jgi:hypothetical protein|uniref:Uncharacterized protein n=1 Tax=Candidatus Wallbacteria bacterium HGW-Wallbacteria-1 TaxID=2013854 RepID=A0A2N1PIH7_9BACT|nr:MAG: hypothetical protein CVV64_20050 [Candidatus Wallbacteria bacterium HGW-Wallbacteria-1]